MEGASGIVRVMIQDRVRAGAAGVDAAVVTAFPRTVEVGVRVIPRDNERQRRPQPHEEERNSPRRGRPRNDRPARHRGKRGDSLPDESGRGRRREDRSPRIASIRISESARVGAVVDVKRVRARDDVRAPFNSPAPVARDEAPAPPLLTEEIRRSLGEDKRDGAGPSTPRPELPRVKKEPGASSSAPTHLIVPTAKAGPSPWLCCDESQFELDEKIATGHVLRVWIEPQPNLPRCKAPSEVVFYVLQRGARQDVGIDVEGYLIGARAPTLAKLLHAPFNYTGPVEDRAVLHFCATSDCVSRNDTNDRQFTRIHAVAILACYCEDLRERWRQDGSEKLSQVMADNLELPRMRQAPAAIRAEGERRARVDKLVGEIRGLGKTDRWQATRLRDAGGSTSKHFVEQAPSAVPTGASMGVDVQAGEDLIT